MSLFLLIDEDSQAKYLVNLLRAAGHDVVTANEVEIMGLPDEEVLNYARQQNRVVLTRNCGDFLALHQVNPKHPGILAIYQESNPERNMGYRDVVRAIENLQAAGLVLADQFVVLNQWRY
ncbi:MAG: hypothetical protein F6J87_00910 [Spirulina sp. SIO3F2]|nr:hypothetical protein [Spirulina sp. SIO3F2]